MPKESPKNDATRNGEVREAWRDCGDVAKEFLAIVTFMIGCLL
jgi:hypothetical protein